MVAPYEIKGQIPRPAVKMVDKDGYVTDEWRRQYLEPVDLALFHGGSDSVFTLNTIKLESGDDVSELVNDANYVTTAESQEIVEDFVGAMVTGNTEVRIAVTYDDGTGKLNLTVEDDLSVYDNSVTAFITNATASLNTSKITAGTFADARIAESNVTQHEAALTVAQSQVTGLTTALSGKVSTTTITSLTDSTGGSAGGTLAAVGDTSTTDQSSTINDNFASLNAKLNAVLSALA